MPVTFIKSSTGDLLQQAAERMEPRLRAAFLRAVAALRGTVADDKLMEAVAAGDVNGVMSMLAIDDNFVAALNGKGIPAGVESFRDALQASFAAGASAAVRSLPSRVGLNLSFDMMSKDAQAFLEQYTFPLIRQLSANTTEGIRSVVLDAFRNGGHPYVQARTIKTFIGLTETQAKAVLNYRAALSSPSTLGQSLDRKLRDGRFDSTVERAIRNNAGLSADQIDRMSARYEERYIQYRARTIARSESLRASVKGQRETWRQAVQQGLLARDQMREWETSGDERTCEICAPLDGEVRGLNEEFAPGILDPGDPHSTCRCSAKLVFVRAA
jgi:hypothetical protein